uniref:peptidylprolyl isomerase n=1 Tax=candidate division WOR-3 bacterium TaxID=2052148 RepID=A0A7C4GIA8_UNCW3
MKRIVQVAMLVAVLAGCQSGTGLRQAPGKAIGTVGGEKVTDLEVDYQAEQMRAAVSRDNIDELLDHMVTVTLLAQEAVRRGMLKDPATVAKLAWVERVFLASEVAQTFATGRKPTSGEILEYYNSRKDDFAHGLKLMLMVLRDSLVAEQTRAELLAGADFRRLALERSLDTSMLRVPGYPTRGVGMSLGWDLAEEEAVFDLKPGEVSPVIATPVGYQLVKLVEKKRVTDNPVFNEITQMYVEEALKTSRNRAAMDSVLTALRAAAKIELSPDAYFSKGK